MYYLLLILIDKTITQILCKLKFCHNMFQKYQMKKRSCNKSSQKSQKDCDCKSLSPLIFQDFFLRQGPNTLSPTLRSSCLSFKFEPLCLTDLAILFFRAFLDGWGGKGDLVQGTAPKALCKLGKQSTNALQTQP